MSRAFPSRRYYDILLTWPVYSLWLLPDQTCAHVFLTRFSNRETSWLYLVHYRSLRPAWVACSRRLPSPHCVLGLYLNLLHREAIPLCMAAVCTMYGVFILEPSPRRSHSLVRDWHQPKGCCLSLCSEFMPLPSPQGSRFLSWGGQFLHTVLSVVQ